MEALMHIPRILFFVTLFVSTQIAAAAGAAVHTSYWHVDDTDDAFGLGFQGYWGWLELRGTYLGDVTAKPQLAGRSYQVTILPLEAGLTYRFNADSGPYISAGASYLLVDTSLGDVDNAVGWYAVAGAEFGPDTGPALLLELAYRAAQTNVRWDRPGVSAGNRLSLSGPGANASLLWRY